MSNDKEVMQEKKSANMKLKMTLSIIVLSALFIIGMYLMINFPNNYIALAIVGIVMLLLIYRITDLSFKIQAEREDRREMEFENLFKSQKASYLMLRKNFEDIGENMDKILKGTEMPVEELISAQKSIAKVTINRSKENTVALMNSNDKMLDRLINMEEKMGEIQKSFTSIEESVTNNQNVVSDHVTNIFESKLVDIFDRMKELEDSINKEMAERLSSIKVETVAAPISEEVLSEPVSEPEITEELLIEPQVDIPEEMKEEEIKEPETVEGSSLRVESLAEGIDLETEIPEELEKEVEALEEAVETEEPEFSTLEIEKEVTEDLSVTVDEEIKEPESIIDDNHKMTPDEIEQLINLADSVAKEEPEMPSMEELEKLLQETPVQEDDTPVDLTEIVEEPVVPEPIPEPEPEIMPEPIPEPEPEVMPEPIPELTPEISSDPNHVMTPDEIAALIGEATVALQPEPEPEPMPAISNDPNHVMTPDEIAALLGSM